jgi:2-dehydro-3-deoxyglucarate aldolase/4-hydroxy-2-oxoheptanedioate aldolase
VSSLSETIDRHGVAVGVMLYEFDTPGVTRILAAAGVDFAIFDMEHTGWDAGTLRTTIATGRGTGVRTIARVVRAEYALVATALDAGCRGVMAPMVESGAQARLLVESARYPPLGRRGFGMLFSDELADGPGAYTRRANLDNVVIAQIETVAGIENADEIVGVPGIDAVWLGQFDLSLSLGIPGDFEHPAFGAALDRLSETCARHGKPLGQMVATVDEALALRERGFTIFAYADVWLFEGAVRGSLDALRSVR